MCKCNKKFSVVQKVVSFIASAVLVTCAPAMLCEARTGLVESVHVSVKIVSVCVCPRQKKLRIKN